VTGPWATTFAVKTTFAALKAISGLSLKHVHAYATEGANAVIAAHRTDVQNVIALLNIFFDIDAEGAVFVPFQENF
jgi:hypothetical protein